MEVLCGQKPQWRNKVKKVFDETGYELDGKFLTSEKANRLGMENPDLVMKFRKGVRRWQDRNHSQLTERSPFFTAVPNFLRSFVGIGAAGEPLSDALPFGRLLRPLACVLD